MRKERISSDVDRKLRLELDEKANALGISRAKYIEISLKSELGRFNIHKENKRLTEERAQAEQETVALRQQLTSEKTQLTEQRDEFEKLLHAETDAYNKCHERVESLKKERDTFKENLKQIASHLGVPDTVEHCQQRIDELQESIDDKKKERDTFKAKFEDQAEAVAVSEEKVNQLLNRNWWERLWNKMPWITEISLPIDKTIE